MKTGIAYSELTTWHASAKNHPECPSRVIEIYSHLKEQKWFNPQTIFEFGSTAREATDPELLLAHTKKHISFVRRNGNYPKLKKWKNDLFFNEHSSKSALIACGLVLDLSEMVINSTLKNGFAIIRPPGHHAGRDGPSGFCLFNNVAVAAKNAVKNHGVKRVLIFDWDVHHGNGTQEIVADDDSILFISMHRYEESFYPGTGHWNDTGLNNKKTKPSGKVINIPFYDSYGDADVLFAFQKIVLPVVTEFDPQLILISAGFDSVYGDQLGQCTCSPQLFGNLLHMLTSFADGKVVCALEGGYNLDQLKLCVSECCSVLTQGVPSPIPETIPLPNSRKKHKTRQIVQRCHKQMVRNVVSFQTAHWKQLKVTEEYVDSESIEDLIVGFDALNLFH